MEKEPKFIAQGLLRTWKLEREHDPTRTPPLDWYMKFQYEERYAKLCRRLGVNPVPYVKWLRKEIKDVI